MNWSRKWPCVFRRPEIRADVNPRLLREWRERHEGEGEPPFAAFQRTWRQRHCQEINPYGSEDCPYAARDCILAYYKTASDSIWGYEHSALGFFRWLAQRRGYERSENKPLARNRPQERTFVQVDPGPSDAGAVSEGDETGRRLRAATPRSVASLLGAPDAGPLLAPTRRREGQEGPER